MWCNVSDASSIWAAYAMTETIERTGIWDRAWTPKECPAGRHRHRVRSTGHPGRQAGRQACMMRVAYSTAGFSAGRLHIEELCQAHPLLFLPVVAEVQQRLFLIRRLQPRCGPHRAVLALVPHPVPLLVNRNTHCLLNLGGGGGQKVPTGWVIVCFLSKRRTMPAR